MNVVGAAVGVSSQAGITHPEQNAFAVHFVNYFSLQTNSFSIPIVSRNLAMFNLMLLISIHGGDT